MATLIGRSRDLMFLEPLCQLGLLGLSEAGAGPDRLKGLSERPFGVSNLVGREELLDLVRIPAIARRGKRTDDDRVAAELARLFLDLAPALPGERPGQLAG